MYVPSTNTPILKKKYDFPFHFFVFRRNLFKCMDIFHKYIYTQFFITLYTAIMFPSSIKAYIFFLYNIMYGETSIVAGFFKKKKKIFMFIQKLIKNLTMYYKSLEKKKV